MLTSEALVDAGFRRALLTLTQMLMCLLTSEALVDADSDALLVLR